MSQWLTEVSEVVAKELERLKDVGVTQSVIRLPQRPQEVLDRFAELPLRDNETMRNLIQLCPSPVKVSNFSNKGILGYQITVPSELKNIIIIRDLVRDDTSVIDAEEHLPTVKGIGVPLASLKRYDGTTVYQMSAGGGKSSVAKSFTQKYARQRRICKEVIEVLKHVPHDESTLVIAFKSAYDHSGPVNFVKTLEDDITASGVVTMKNQDSVEVVESTQKPRVSITTWGLHKGTNRHKHCKNLIMVGILHRDIMNLLRETTGHREAIGRIQCRTVVNGVALPVNIWLIHYGTNLKEKLEPVMQGAVWKKWQTKYDEIPEGKESETVKAAAQAVSTHLDRLVAARKVQTSSKELRQAVLECLRLDS